MTELHICEACVCRTQPNLGTRVVFASTPELGRFTMLLCKEEHAAIARRIYSAPRAYITNPECPGTMIEGRFQ